MTKVDRKINIKAAQYLMLAAIDLAFAAGFYYVATSHNAIMQFMGGVGLAITTVSALDCVYGAVILLRTPGYVRYIYAIKHDLND